MFFGFPNIEWVRVWLRREIVLDRARAQAAIAETERCQPLLAAGRSRTRFASSLT